MVRQYNPREQVMKLTAVHARKRDVEVLTSK